MKNFPGLGNTGLVTTNHHHTTVVMQNPPNQPEKDIPVKPDKNPDPTKPRPGVNEPEKVDPTRIPEPAPDPTRIEPEPAPGPTRIDPEQAPGEPQTIW